MHRKTGVGPRMEPWRTPVTMGHFCEDLPSQNHSKLSITEKKKKVKYLTQNSIKLKFSKEASMQNHV